MMSWLGGWKAFTIRILEFWTLRCLSLSLINILLILSIKMTWIRNRLTTLTMYFFSLLVWGNHLYTTLCIIGFIFLFSLGFLLLLDDIPIFHHLLVHDHSKLLAKNWNFRHLGLEYSLIKLNDKYIDLNNIQMSCMTVGCIVKDVIIFHKNYLSIHGQ